MILGALVVGLVALAAVAVLALGAARSGEQGLTVFAAASLRDVARPIEAAWNERRPDVPLTLSFAGSNILAAQIAEGAPADVFLSADMQHPDDLIDAGLGVGAVAPFARNGLAIVAAPDAAVETPADLAARGTRIVAAATEVPISRYASELLALLAATTSDPAAFLSATEANVVSREDNVRGALTKVELGEGDAAIVYASDLLASEAVRSIELPLDIDVEATYGALRLTDDPVAADFIEWLMSEPVAAILGGAGFRPVSA